MALGTYCFNNYGVPTDKTMQLGVETRRVSSDEEHLTLDFYSWHQTKQTFTRPAEEPEPTVNFYARALNVAVTTKNHCCSTC